MHTYWYCNIILSGQCHIWSAFLTAYLAKLYQPHSINTMQSIHQNICHIISWCRPVCIILYYFSDTKLVEWYYIMILYYGKTTIIWFRFRCSPSMISFYFNVNLHPLVILAANILLLFFDGHPMSVKRANDWYLAILRGH